MEQKTLDLNQPEDARAYVISWINPEDIESLEYASDLHYLIVARQLFISHDLRPALGGIH